MVLAGNLAQVVTGFDRVVHPGAGGGRASAGRPGGTAGGATGGRGGGGAAVGHFFRKQDVGLVAGDGVLQVQEGGGVVEGKAEHDVFRRPRDDVFVVLGIQVTHVVDGNAQHFADLGHVEIAVHVEGVYIHGNGHWICLEAVFLGIGEGVHGAHHGRNIAAGFPGQVVVDGPEVPFSAGALDGLVHVPGAAVIGRYGQRPVPENPVGVPQVAGGGIGRQERIHPLVHVGIYPQPVIDGRAIHELPGAAGPRRRFRPGIQRAFDDGHVLEFQWKVVPAESLLEDGEVIGRQAHHLRHFPRHFLRVQHHVVFHALIVRKADEGVHFLQPAHEHRVRNVGSEHHRVHVIFRLAGTAAAAVHVPLAQERVRSGVRGVVIHAGGLFVLVFAGKQLFDFFPFLLFQLDGFDGGLQLYDPFPQLLVFLFQLLTGFASAGGGGQRERKKDKGGGKECFFHHSHQNLRPIVMPTAGGAKA